MQRTSTPVFLRLFLIGFALVMASVGSLSAEEPTPPPETSATESPSTEDQPLNIDIPTVEGQDVLGIRIPHHDETGKLVFQLSAEKARRLNDQDIAMQDMELIFYDDQNEKFEVNIPQSTFNLETKQLHGEEGATITREDFTIEGQVIDFDLAKQSGVLRGDVTMTIHQIDRLESEP
jgi:lipopolysaccharide export system protein LptC